MSRVRPLAFALVALGALVAGAGPAGAHAQLRSTEPVSGQRFDDSPERILLTFTEAVEVSFGAVAVYNEDGERLRLGQATHPEGNSRAVAIDLPDLDQGGYVVTWRVVSADSHPVRGAFTFRVGTSSGDDRSADLAQRLLAAEGGNTSVGAVFGVVRFAVFAGLLLLIGATVFAVCFWPAGRDDGRLRALIAFGWVVAALGTLMSIGLQGAYAGGLALADAVRPSVVGDVVGTRYGQVSLGRLALLLLAIPMTRLSLRPGGSRNRPIVVAAAGAVALALAATPGLAGHAGASQPVALALTLDTIHVGMAAAWIGGLAAMATAALPRGGAADGQGIDVGISRFSRFAVLAVGAVVVTGSIQGWRQSESVDAITSTTYGRVLLVKVGLVAAILIVASASRRTVRQRRDGRGLRRLVAIEVAVAVAVIAASAVLVNLIPAKTALALPVSTTITAGDVLIDITIDPAKAGPTDIHLYTLTRDGGPREVAELTAELDLQGRDLNPVDVPLQAVGPGHFAAYDFDVPIAGRWRLTLTVRTGDVDQSRGSKTITVR